jgi:hypothetical protein
MQNGTLTVSRAGSTDSVAVFLGNVYGGGASGEGDIFYEGEVHPGNSAALVTYQNDVAFGGGATLAIELGGTTLGTEYDALDITGSLVLGGTLSVVAVNLGSGLFQPDEGDVFQILTATGGISGEFTSMNLPQLTGHLDWDVLQDADSLTLAVVAPGLPGDFNGNGVVDAADYVVWRKGLGTTYTPADYKVWRANLGRTAGSSAVAVASSFGGHDTGIPEPGSFWLTLGAAIIGFRLFVNSRYERATNESSFKLCTRRS